MKDHPDAADVRKREALERLVRLYDAWHEAALARFEATLKQAATAEDPGGG